VYESIILEPATFVQANDYVSEGKSSYKSMLLNNVILGKTIKLTTNNEKLTKVHSITTSSPVPHITFLRSRLLAMMLSSASPAVISITMRA
jgi:hypothetical protein